MCCTVSFSIRRILTHTWGILKQNSTITNLYIIWNDGFMKMQHFNHICGFIDFLNWKTANNKYSLPFFAVCSCLNFIRRWYSDEYHWAEEIVLFSTFICYTRFYKMQQSCKYTDLQFLNKLCPVCVQIKWSNGSMRQHLPFENDKIKNNKM